MIALSPEELLGPLNDVEIKYAPKMLYVEGDASLLKVSPRVAVIGTRHPTELGKRRAARLSRLLIKNSSIIVSGLAEGIDTIAHCTAMENGGRTIAVLGTNLDQVYPKKNAKLQHEIMDRHLAISQFPPGWPIQRMNFPMRNRTMALIVDASIIVEAGNGSGTLSQGWEMLRLGKALYILKSICDDPSLSWPRKMLDYGAILLTEPETLIADLPTPDDQNMLHVGF
jgi:DNA processing protein